MASTKGPLQTKLEPRYLPLIGSDEARGQVIDKWVSEDHAKLLLLAEEMGIAFSEHMFYQLALALARKHCIGFQQRSPTGKWTELTRSCLVVEIERLTANRRRVPGHTVTWAAKVLSTRPEWAEFLDGAGDAAESLRVQYQKHKKSRMAALCRDAFRMHRHEGTIEAWDELVLSALQSPHPPQTPYP
jgi:hypothetical protein